MRVRWDIILIDQNIFVPHAYFFKKMPHFLFKGEEKGFLVVYSSSSVGRYVNPEYAPEGEALKFIERALEEDSFDEHVVIINHEEEDIRRKLREWEKKGKVIVAETPYVMLERPPYELEELVRK